MNREPDVATTSHPEQQALQIISGRLGTVREDLFGVIDDVDRLLPQHADPKLCEALQDANNGVGRAENRLVSLWSSAVPGA